MDPGEDDEDGLLVGRPIEDVDAIPIGAQDIAPAGGELTLPFELPRALKAALQELPSIEDPGSGSLQTPLAGTGRLRHHTEEVRSPGCNDLHHFCDQPNCILC